MRRSGDVGSRSDHFQTHRGFPPEQDLCTRQNLCTRQDLLTERGPPRSRHPVIERGGLRDALNPRNLATAVDTRCGEFEPTKHRSALRRKPPVPEAPCTRGRRMQPLLERRTILWKGQHPYRQTQCQTSVFCRGRDGRLPSDVSPDARMPDSSCTRSKRIPQPINDEQQISDNNRPPS